MIVFCDFRNQKSKQKLFDYLKALDNVYKVDIKRDRKGRSNPQNRYYRGVVVKMISEETGYTPEEVHEILKTKFLSYEKVIEKTGEVFTISRSTTELNTQEFEEFLEMCRMFAAQDIEIVIPLPNECIEI